MLVFFIRSAQGPKSDARVGMQLRSRVDRKGMQDIFQEADAHWPGPAECDQASDFGEEPVALMALLARLD